MRMVLFNRPDFRIIVIDRPQNAGSLYLIEERIRMAKPRQGLWYRWLKWGDFVIAAIVIALAVILLVTVPDRIGSSSAAAVLTRDGEIIRQWTADELMTSGEAVFENRGFHYTIAWEDGRIRFAEADCPDQICVRTGWLEQDGDLAACVPGHLIIKTSSRSPSDDQPDVIVR